MSIGFGGASFSDDLVRRVQYVIDAQGQQGVDDLNNSLRNVTAEIAHQGQEYRAGRLTLEEFDKAVSTLGRRQADLASQVVVANRAMAEGGRVTSEMVTQLRRAESAIGSRQGGGVAMGLMMLSQLADDAQYGFKSIVNNIPPLVLALTGNVGLAGAAGIAAVAANLFLQKWEQWNRDSKVYADSTAGLTEQIKDMARAHDTSAAAAERERRAKERLKEVETDLAAFKKHENPQSADEKRSADAFGEYIDRAGGTGALADAVEQARRARGDFLKSDEQKRIDDARAAIAAAQKAEGEHAFIDNQGRRAIPQEFKDATDAAVRELAKAESEAFQAARKRIDAQVGRVARGINIDRQELLYLARQGDTADFFKGGQRAALELADPRMLRESEESNRDAARRMESGKKRREEQEKADKAADRAIAKEVDANLKLEQEAERKRKAADEKIARDKQADAKRAAQQRDQLVNQLAGKIGGGAGGLEDQLGPAIAQRLARGEDPEAIVKALASQVAGRIQGLPTGVPGMGRVGLMAPTVADRIVRNALQDRLGDMGRAVGQGDDAAGAAEFAGANAQRANDRADRRGMAADRREMANDRAEAVQGMMARQFMGMGANPQAAQAMAAEAFRLTERGFNAQLAMMNVMEKFQANAQRMQAEMNHMQRRIGNLDRGANSMRWPDMPLLPQN